MNERWEVSPGQNYAPLVTVPIERMPPLDGLKAIADFVEGLAGLRGIAIRPVTVVDVWRWARRRGDRLPTYARKPSKPATMADPVAVESWFSRRRFAVIVDDRVSV